jgi:hypothetical protein
VRVGGRGVGRASGVALCPGVAPGLKQLVFPNHKHLVEGLRVPLLDVGDGLFGFGLADAILVYVQVDDQPHLAAVAFLRFSVDRLFKRAGDSFSSFNPVINGIQL